MKYRFTQKQMAILNANFAILFLAACAQGGSTIRRPGGDPAGGGDPTDPTDPADPTDPIDPTDPADVDSLTLSSAAGSIAEGTIASAYRLAVVSLNGTDYTLTIDQADRFELQNNELRIKAGASFDFEEAGDRRVEITVTAAKDEADTLEQVFTLTVTDILGPEFTSPLNATIDENDTSFSQTLSVESYNLPVTLTIGDDYEGPITLTGNRLHFAAGQSGFDFETDGNRHTVPLSAETREGRVDVDFVITIQNILPHFTTSHHRDGVLVSEASTYIYQPTHNEAQNFTYSLSDNSEVAGNDAAYFTIDAATGAVRFVAGHIPDPLIKSSYSVILTARATIDGEPFEATQIFSLNVLQFPLLQARQHEGTNEDDTLTATAADDSLFGRAGNDILVASRGRNLLDGGAGQDTASYYNAREAVTIDLSQADADTGEVTLGEDAGREAIYDVLRSIENLRGGDHDDHLSGDWRDNVIEGGGGADTVDGRSGRDTLSYRNAASAVTVNLSASADSQGFILQTNTPASDAASDKVRGFLNIDGSDFNDRLTGDHNANRLQGFDGDDVLLGGGGQDVLDGGTGNDVITLSQFTQGNIVYRLESSTTDNTVSFTDGSDVIHNFQLSGSFPDKLLFVDTNEAGLTAREALEGKDITVDFLKTGNDFTGFTLTSGDETLTVNLYSTAYLTGDAAANLQVAIDDSAITDISALLTHILTDTVFDITTDTTPSGINVLL